MINKLKKDIQNKIHGVGEQFVDDVMKILEQSPNPYIIEMLQNALVSKQLFC